MSARLPEKTRVNLEALVAFCREGESLVDDLIQDAVDDALSQLTAAGATPQDAAAAIQQRISAAVPAAANTIFRMRRIPSEALWSAQILLKGPAASSWEQKIGYPKMIRNLQRQPEGANLAERLELARAEILAEGG